jgi:hypothetical protein
MSTGSFPGIKRPGRCFGHQPPSSAEVKESVELHLYSPSGPSWAVLGWTLVYFYYKSTLQPVQRILIDCYSFSCKRFVQIVLLQVCAECVTASLCRLCYCTIVKIPVTSH